MIIQKKNRSLFKNPLFWVGALLVIVLLVFGLEKVGITNFVKDTAVQGPTEREKQQDAEAAAAKKKATIEESETKADPYGTSDATSDKSLDLSAKQEANNTVTVFTKLYGYSDGTCTLTVTNGGKTTSQTAEAMYQPEYASCAGFSVPIDTVGRGSWTIKLSVLSAEKTSDKTITFEVK